jgi:hypothetical protein
MLFVSSLRIFARVPAPYAREKLNLMKGNMHLIG